LTTLKSTNKTNHLRRNRCIRLCGLCVKETGVTRGNLAPPTWWHWGCIEPRSQQ